MLKFFRLLSWGFVKFCVRPSLPFGSEGGMWDVTVLISDHCLSYYFEHCSFCTKTENLVLPYSTLGDICNHK